MLKMKVYLDNGATTQVDEKVVKKMLPYFTEKYGNASSLHSFGQEAKLELEDARRTIRKKLNADKIIFCSGGSESDNLAIKVVAYAKGKGHIITSNIEHPAVEKTCKSLEKDGFEVTYLNVNYSKLCSMIGGFDEIRAHHILEHFKPENKVKVLSLCWDLLKEGGILDIEVPLFPHPASVQDPTHISFWTVESFKYFIKGDPFGEAFAKRYSEYPVPLFEKVEDWYKGGEKYQKGYVFPEDTKKEEIEKINNMSDFERKYMIDKSKWVYGIKLKKVIK